MSRKPRSINQRVILAAAVLLLLFVILTGAALDKAFRESAETARRERLSALAYLLMAAAEVDEQGVLHMPPQLAETRLQLPGSGLYARVQLGRTQWLSASNTGRAIPFADSATPGQPWFGQVDMDHQRYWALSMQVSWPVGVRRLPLLFSVSEDLRDFERELNTYRRTLWGWLAASAVLLLLTQTVLLRWGLRPLRQVARALRRIEQGEGEQLDGPYPRELQGLTRNLNTLLQRERAQQQRYRHALADLAHSLKTPLAVLKGTPEDDAEFAHTVREQCQRMETLVGYQLQRAATAGSAPFAAARLLAPQVQRITDTLSKVYRDRSLQFQQDIPPDFKLRLDEGDLLELLGNLIDNAAKWATHQVRISAQREGERCTLSIEDDGPGISDPSLMQQRGVRADEAVPGHGIGLAIVNDIVNAYQGRLDILRSDALGGASIRIQFNGV